MCWGRATILSQVWESPQWEVEIEQTWKRWGSEPWVGWPYNIIRMGTLLRLCVLTLEYQAQMGTLSGKPGYTVILAMGRSGRREFQVEERASTKALRPRECMAVSRSSKEATVARARWARERTGWREESEAFHEVSWRPWKGPWYLLWEKWRLILS